MSGRKFRLTREQREILLVKLQIGGFSLPRIAGRALGAIMPSVSLGDVDDDDPLAGAFADGVAEGKLARGLGDLLTAPTQPKPKDDNDDE